MTQPATREGNTEVVRAMAEELGVLSPSGVSVLTAASKALLRLASSYKTQPRAQMSLFWL